MAKSTAKKNSANVTVEKATATNESSTVNADSSLQQLFMGELKDTYWAENHLVKSLPKMIAAAGSAELRQALTQHLEETINQVARIEQAFELLGQKIAAKKCDAMEGLTMSGEHVIENTLTGTPVRDTGIIMSALKVENFEITTYTGLISVANALGKTDVADLLKQNLDEEIDASDLLMQLSQEATEKSLS